MKNRGISEDVYARAGAVRLLLMDCDGVLTDGRLYFSDSGEAMKVFNVRDGQGIAEWHAAGYMSGIITGRDARAILEKRAAELSMKFLYTSSRDKLKDLTEIISLSGVSLEEIAYVGDDIGDICILERVGLPIVVADAAERVLPFARFQTRKAGGHGAIREVTDMILAAKQN